MTSRQQLLAQAALTAVLGGAVAWLVQSPPVSAQVALDRVEVTGSRILRTDTETVSPVEVITREDIERSGKATLADLLRAIPANSAGNYGESFTNSFAPGASGISLRGLGLKATLVLINGRRVAGFGFAQFAQDTFVDLNSIPASAVDRIEIVKDGASAIHGSDAIAGVVNVILRRDFAGVEAAAAAGFFESRQDYRASIAIGSGDVDADRYNVFGVLDYYRRDLLRQADARFYRSRDFRGEQGGRNFQSLTGGGTWRQLTAGGAVTNVHRAITGCRGTVMAAEQAVEAGLLAATSPLNQSGNTFCTRDFSDSFTALPATERVGFFGQGTVELGAGTRAYTEIGTSRVETFQTFQEVAFAGSSGLLPTSAGLRRFPYNVNFAPGAAGNPFTTPARYVGVLNDLGTRDAEVVSDTTRALVGLKYELRAWNLDSAVGVSGNRVEAFLRNHLSLAGTSAVFDVPASPQPPVPTSGNSTYNLDDPALNGEDVRNRMRLDVRRIARSTLKFVDTKASTRGGELPGGSIGFAAGMEYRNETMREAPDSRVASGDLLGGLSLALDGSRHQFAVFGELALPVTRTLEVQAALRNDAYSDVGTALVPKVGLKLRPARELLIRANWGRGFRAPTLPENSRSAIGAFAQVIDPFSLPTPGAAVVTTGVLTGNPDLGPEKSRSGSIGFVVEPAADLSFGVSFYEITLTGIVRATAFQDLVNRQDPGVLRDPTTGEIVTIVGTFGNADRTLTRGADFDARCVRRSALGRFVTRLQASYVDTYVDDGVEIAGNNSGRESVPSVPRLKAFVSVDWERGAWVTSARANYVHHYAQSFLAGTPFFAAQDPRFQTGTLPRRVPSQTTLDLFVRHAATQRLSVSMALLNATDQLPPYDPSFAPLWLYDLTQYDTRGRQVRVGFQYRLD